jgi:hypothetical protein
MKCAIILREFQRFDTGTTFTIGCRSKFVLLADEIYNKKVFLKCLIISVI